MKFSRRDFGKAALGTVPAAAALMSMPGMLSAQGPMASSSNPGKNPALPQPAGFLPAPGKPDSTFAGVRIGVITPYSYHGEKSDAQSILNFLLTNGIQATEMQSQTAEPFAGAPQQANPFAGGARRGPVPAAGRRGPGAPSRRGGGGRRTLTPAQQAARAKQEAAMTQWRLSVPMSKYEALRRLYNDAGVDIYGFKLGLTLTMPDAEYDYAFNVVKALGGNQLTMEHPGGADADKLTARIGKFASKHKTMVGYHAHTQAKPHYWDTAMSQSPYNGINLDVGHYVAAGNHDVLAFVQKNHARITSMHLKDRCYPGDRNASNEPWGEGDTPLVQLLRLMRDNKYTFPGTIELEYAVPPGSNSIVEVGRCLAFARYNLLTT